MGCLRQRAREGCDITHSRKTGVGLLWIKCLFVSDFAGGGRWFWQLDANIKEREWRVCLGS